MLGFLHSVGAPGTSLAQNAEPDCRLSLELKGTLHGSGRQIQALIFSPDGRLLAPLTWDKKTELWNTKTHQLSATVEGRLFRPFSYADLKAIDAFSPDGHTLATIRGKEAMLWDPGTGHRRWVLKGHQKDIRSAAFSPDSRILATGSADGTVKLWNAETGKLERDLAAYRVKNYPRWRVVSRFFTIADIFISFSSDGERLLTVPYNQATRLWDVKTGRLEATLGDNFHAKFSPRGRYVLSQRSDFTGTDLWETESGRLTATFKDGDAAFSPNEQWLGLVEYHGKKGLLNLRTMEVEIPLSLSLNNFVSWICFSQDNRIFGMASGLYGHSAALVDVSTGKVIADIPIVGKKGFDFISDYLKYTEGLSFDPSGRILMGANQELVRFWDARSGHKIMEAPDGRDPATFSPDGKVMASVARDKKSILLWSVKLSCD